MHRYAYPPCGPLRGTLEDGVEVYRGVPYAAPPVGPLRFAPTVPIGRWRDARDATADGPIPPQPRSRFATVLGDSSDLPQSEDCLTLNVHAPAAESGGCSVLVWIHGGGLVGGAGSLSWYDGATLARRGNVVVVSPNFRQGVLGQLYLPGISPGNLALLDLVEVLRWVHSNIAAFGGNPDAVVLFGQSSGAALIADLMAMPAAKGLFHRAIMQSAPLGRPRRSAGEAAALGARFARCLGLESTDAEGFRRAPVPALLAAQAEYARSFGSAVVGASEQAFGSVIDDRVRVPDAQGWGYSGTDGIDLLVGTVREEMATAYSIDPAVRGATSLQVMQSFEHVGAGEAPGLHEYYSGRRPSRDAGLILGDLYTDLVFRLPILRLAETQVAAGHKVWVYQFDWQSPAGFGACHCLELPFVFGNLQAWESSHVMRGVDPSLFRGLSDVMQDAWIAFAHRGDPNGEGSPFWPSYAECRATRRFDLVVDTVADLAGLATCPLYSRSR